MDLHIDAIQFTPMDVAAVAQALDLALNETRSRRLFTAFTKAIRNGDNTIDLAWALAQALHNVMLQQPDGEKQTEVLRTFITMVALVGSKRRERMETQH